MIDVALTGLYDVCLFNSAAQVLFFFNVRSGQCVLYIWIFLRTLVVPGAVSSSVDKMSSEIMDILFDFYVRRPCWNMVITPTYNPSKSARLLVI